MHRQPVPCMSDCNAPGQVAPDIELLFRIAGYFREFFYELIGYFPDGIV